MNVSVTATTFNSTGNWLGISPNAVQTTPATYVVFVNSNQLAAGIYNGAITITASGATNSPLSVPVTLTVGTPTESGLAVSLTSLSFTGQAGGLQPASQAVSVTSTTPNLNFTATATTTTAIPWLSVNPTAAIAPAALTISVNTAGLTSGVYTGTVTITGVSGGSASVAVTLTVTSGTFLTTSASSLQFFYQVGSFLPTNQTFTVSSGSVPISFNVTTSTTVSSGWLSASPLLGSTPGTVTVSISPANLPVGVYSGKVTVSSPTAGNPSLDVPVTLTVSTGALLTVGATPTTFVYQIGDTAPASQIIPISSSSGQLSFNATSRTSNGGNWLTVTPTSGSTPQNLVVSVSPGSLIAGTYSGSIVVTAAGAANSPVTIPISLSIGSGGVITTSLQAVVLNFQIGGANQVLSQPVVVTSSGQSVQFTTLATTSTCGANWLQVLQSTGVTPATITIAIDASSIGTPQTCTGTVAITPVNGTPIQLPVTVNVSQNPLFNITPLALNLSAPFGSENTVQQNINLSVTDNSAVSFTVPTPTTTSGNWLRVAPSSGTTPSSITVIADPNFLSVGTYTGIVQITSTALPTAQSIPVTFRILATATGAATPSALTFTQTVGGTAPAAQNVALSSTGTALSFVTTTSTTDLGQWLSVTPITGTTPATLSVSANGRSLAAGTYTGSINITLQGASNNPLSIPVTLNVLAGAPVLTASVPALAFTYQTTGATPAAQQITVSSTGGASSIAATPSTSSGGDWLTVSPSSAASPAGFSVTVNPTGLAVGSYNGTITFASTGAAALSVPVRLDVTVRAGAPPTVNSISNAASGVRGVISPGEIITIVGDSMGPAEGASLRLKADGTLETTIAGTRVFFDEFPAPILYTSPRQINAIVPYEVASRSTVSVVVEYQTLKSQAFVVQLGASAPGLFTSAQTGRGQGAILNQNNSLNGQFSPAAKGSIVQVFGTGEGVTQPAAVTGSVTAGILVPVGRVTATIGGVPADVVFAGAAPQAVAGLFQVNVRVPNGVVSGDVPITITVGNVPSQTGVTLAVQ